VIPALVVAALLGAGPDASDALAALPPAGTTDALLLQALPPPPDSVTLDASYGAVTFSHSGHLSRRTRCVACHGQGAVTKVDFTPKVAHQRCKGCHREEKRGPLGCRDCHAVAPAPGLEATRTTLAQAGTAPAATGRQRGGAPGPASLQAHGAVAQRTPFHLTLEAGAAAAGDAWGPSVRLSARQGRLVISQGVDRLAGDTDRLVALFAAGVVQPIHRRVGVFALAAGGVDVLRKPFDAISPAIGSRVGIEFLPSSSLGSFHLSVTGLVDVSRRRDEQWNPSRTTVFATLGTGVSARRR
jgi:hypothetical protein